MLSAAQTGQFFNSNMSLHREGTCKAIVEQGPLEIYNSSVEMGAEELPSYRKSLESHWSKYYRHHRRQAEIIEPLSPWLVERLKSML